MTSVQLPPPLTGPDTAGVALRWGAIAAGAVVTLATMLLLVALGVGLGMSALTGGDGPSPSALKLFTGAWGATAPLISLAVGGWVAGRSAGVSRPGSGALHGLVMWAVASLALVGGLASGVANLAGSIAGGLAGASQQVVGGIAGASRSALGAIGSAGARAIEGGAVGLDAAGNLLSRVDIDLDVALKPINERLAAKGRGPVNPDQLREAGREVLERAAREGRLDRELFVAAIGDRTGISREDAARLADTIEEQLRRAKDRAGELAGQAKARAQQIAEQVREQAGPVAAQAREQAGELAGQAVELARAGAARAAEAVRAAFLGLFVALGLGLAAAVGGATFGAASTPSRR